MDWRARATRSLVAGFIGALAGCTGELLDGPAGPAGSTRTPPGSSQMPVAQAAPTPVPFFDLAAVAPDPGVRMHERGELADTIAEVTGVRADVAELPPEPEVANLRGDSRRTQIIDGRHLDAIARIATEVADRADLDRTVPCASGNCTLEDVRSALWPILASEPDDALASEYLAVYRSAREERDHDFGRRALLQTALLSPHFLYRTEIGDASGLLTAPELARKLAYFVWGRPPDAALLAAARDGSLLRAPVYRAEVDRLLADDRARARAVAFVLDWLNLDGLDLASRPGAGALDPDLARHMRTEIELVVRDVFTRGGTLEDLLSFETTWINEPLAAIYGIEGVTGTDFVEVPLAGTGRRGLLTTALVLAASAKADGRSPIDGFRAMFGDLAEVSGSTLDALWARRASLLDVPSRELSALHGELPAEGRRILDQHLTSLRELEITIREDATRIAAPPEPPEEIAIVPDNHERVWAQWVRIIDAALRLDRTRLVTVQFGGCASRFYVPSLGLGYVGEEGGDNSGSDHHSYTHNDERRARLFTHWLSERAVELLRAMKGDGTVANILQDSAVLTGYEYGWGHMGNDIPVAIFGQYGGYFTSGRTIAYGNDISQYHKHTGTLLALCRAMGVDIDRIGNPSPEHQRGEALELRG